LDYEKYMTRSTTSILINNPSGRLRREIPDIIKEPDGLPPTRECDFEMNFECDEPPKERTYRMSPAKLREVHVAVSL
jgi:hypothetical protein